MLSLRGGLSRLQNASCTTTERHSFVFRCSQLWREGVIALHGKEYSDIELSHMYVDNAAMQLIRWPKQFDVIVTGNIFGDILSDEAREREKDRETRCGGGEHCADRARVRTDAT